MPTLQDEVKGLNSRHLCILARQLAAHKFSAAATPTRMVTLRGGLRPPQATKSITPRYHRRGYAQARQHCAELLDLKS